MSRRMCTTLLAGCLGLLLSAASPLRLVDLQGTPRQRGLQHGRALKAEIRGLLAAFERDLAAMTGQPAAEFIPRFLKETHFEDAARAHTPGLLDEVHGIAEGAGQPFDTLFAFQLMDELWAQGPAIAREKCTSLALAPQDGRPTLLAQNLDVPAWMHAHPTVLRIRHAKPALRSLVVTIPGMIGAMGLNSRRVAVAVNTVLQLAPRRDGLPVAFVVRGLLEQPDDAAARAFLARVPHASGQAYTIGGPDVVTCHEASAHQVVPFSPVPGRVWHTNHPVASTDWAPAIQEAANRSGRGPTFACSRFEAVQAMLGRGGCTLAEARDLLADRRHRVCNPSTYMSILMQLGPTPELQVTAGAPDRTAWRRVPLTPLTGHARRIRAD